MSLSELAFYEHLSSILSILIFKLAVLAVGYLLAKLGYLLLLQGVTGQFKFKGNFQGSVAKFACSGN